MKLTSLCDHSHHDLGSHDHGPVEETPPPRAMPKSKYFFESIERKARRRLQKAIIPRDEK